MRQSPNDSQKYTVCIKIYLNLLKMIFKGRDNIVKKENFEFRENSYQNIISLNLVLKLISL